jgi:EthD domain
MTDRSSAQKVVCVVRGPCSTDRAPDDASVLAFAVHVPCADEPAEHPPEVTALATAWLDHAPDAATVAGWFPGAEVDAYLVDERVRIEYARDWPDGTESPGVVRISFVRAAPGLSRAEMARHWGEVHWPIARVHHPALWRYVQNVVVEPITPGAPDADGIAELHFRTVADLRERFYDSDAGKQVVADDVRLFLERGAGWRVLARETWLRS